MTNFVDTNIFLRHLTNDDHVKAQACLRLFQHAKKNEVTLVTSEAVITEVVYLLSSKRVYNLPRTEIRAKLYPLLSLAGLKLAFRKSYLRALDLYTNLSALDFEDALTVAHMERRQLTEILSYDTDFDQIPSIVRREP